MISHTDTFLKVLDAQDTSTGGGSAAAIAGAMAGALIAMVCQLSSKAQSNNDEVVAWMGTASQAQALTDQLLAGSTADTQAFQAVRRAYKLPKESGEDRQLRSQAIQSAWVEAARIPLQNASRCLQLAGLGLSLVKDTNPAVRSDLNCAMLLARAGFLGCLENIAINLPNIKDSSTATQLGQESTRLRQQLASLDLPVDE